MRVFLEEIIIWISSLSKEDLPHPCKWVSSNLLRAWIEQEVPGRVNLLSWLNLGIHLLPLNISAPGFWAFGLGLNYTISLACLVVQLVDGGSWDFLTFIIMGANSYNKSLSLSSFSLPSPSTPPCIYNIQVFPLLKVYVMPLCFYERTTLLLFLPTKINQRGFLHSWKKTKCKSHVQHWFWGKL